MCGEASRWLDSDAPRQFGSLLSARDVRLYSANPTFARRLRAPGNAGRECLQSFMRLWLASRLARKDPALFRQLPPVFILGASRAFEEPARSFPPEMPENPPRSDLTKGRGQKLFPKAARRSKASGLAIVLSLSKGRGPELVEGFNPA